MGLPQHSMRGLSLRSLIVIAVLIVLAVVAWYFMRTEPPFVVLSKVGRGEVEATVSNTRAGTVKACRRARMSPPAGGQISRINVKKGQRVAAGHILLELWHKDLRAQEALAQEQLTTVRSRASEACTLAAASQREAQRAQQLKDQGFISPQQLDRTLTDAKARQDGCEAARSENEQSSSRIDVARAGLERMVLRAPFNGVVADISGELGEYATPSPPGIPTPPAIDLIDDSCMFVSAPIDEVDAAKLKVGQAGRITLDAIKDKQFPGKVKRIAPYVTEIEKQARTVEVEVVFSPTPDADTLLVGYSADVEIIHDVRLDALRIPTQALIDGQRVLLYGTNGVLEDRAVKTGLANWEYTEIIAGLNEGDQIVKSLDRADVKAGARVQPEIGKVVK